MAGLLFSCGEGIRLFRFPGEKAGVGSSVGTDDGRRIQYEENIPRLVDSREKDEREIDNVGDHQTSLLAESHSLLTYISRNGNVLVGITEPRVLGSLHFALQLSGRAPPAI